MIINTNTLSMLKESSTKYAVKYSKKASAPALRNIIPLNPSDRITHKELRNKPLLTLKTLLLLVATPKSTEIATSKTNNNANQ